LSTTAENAGLERSLGYWDVVLYGLGFVWSESNGLIVLAYLLGGVCMYFTARSYATMTEALPTAGSIYGFARHSLGASSGFIAGWMVLLDGRESGRHVAGRRTDLRGGIEGEAPRGVAGAAVSLP
jgi:amino acid transporter